MPRSPTTRARPPTTGVRLARALRRKALQALQPLIAAWPMALQALGPPAAAQAPPAGAPAPVATPASAAAPAASASAPQRVEITGGRPSDTEERRQSTTTRIVIGRDELDKFGDSTLGEVIRRLPGVTAPGAPGRGGAPRMRGMAGGYTQLLLDGQRLPPGFSLESINPDQVERIEILRAPTAETGTRAIAGTINIVTREGFRRRINDLRLGAGSEGGYASPGLSWTRNDALGPGSLNLSLTAIDIHRVNDSRTETTDTRLADGSLTRDWLETSRSVDHRRNLNLSARVQMPLNADGDAVVLQPSLFHTEGGSRFAGSAANRGPGDAPGYASALNEPASRFTLTRLNTTWRTRLAQIWRLELSGNLSRAESASNSERREFDALGAPSRTLSERNTSAQHEAGLNAKLSRPLGEDGTLLGGLELQSTQRRQASSTVQDLATLSDDLGDPLQARSRRAAAYGQYEWTISPQWSAYAGLRWEGIATDGATPGSATQRNRSSVWTPLAHAVWKPDPKGRDQLRFSLTRSYRSPDLSNLIALPRLSARVDANGPNLATSPDSAGNPGLKPELSTGLDIAFERYPAQGGLLSANLFVKRVTDLIRNVTTLETAVPWSTAAARYVSRPQNIGHAWTLGLELEARLRLDQLFDGAPPTDLHGNLSLFRSRVDAVPGPDNRLAEQPDGTLNLGFDHRLRGTRVSFGGNLNLVPAYRTQLAADRFTDSGRKAVLDGYALWSLGPDTALRLLASNLAPADYATSNSIDADGVRETAATLTPTRLNLQLRLELKL